MSSNVFMVLGWLLLSLAAIAVLPLLAALSLGEADPATGLLVSMGVLIAVGGTLVFSLRGQTRRASRQDGLVLSVLIWPILGCAGALPLLFAGLDVSLTEAVFEGVSAITTTGATLLPSDAVGVRALILWRSILNWLGGLSAIVLAIGVISTLGARTLPLERPQFAPLGSDEAGGTLTDWLLLNGARVGRIYGAITLGVVVVFLMEGLDGITALSLAMSAVSTSGTLPGEPSILTDSFAVQLAVFVAMVFGACNFVLLTGSGRRLVRRFAGDAEMRLLLIVLVLLGLLIAFYRVSHIDGTSPHSAIGLWVRHLWVGLFDSISLISTTGWSASPEGERVLPPLLVIGAVMLGGAAISSAGGLKLVRLILLAAFAGRELERLSHPHGVLRLRIREQIVDERAIDAVWPFFAALLLSMALLTVALSLAGHDFISGLAYSTAALTNSGPMISMVDGAAIGYDDTSPLVKWLLMGGMILGRIEILVLLSLFGPVYGR